MNELLRNVLALPEQASTVAGDVDRLHFFVITVTMFGATVVGLCALYFVLRHRRRYPGELTPRIEAPLLVEVVWVGSLLGLFIGIWLVGYRLYMRLNIPPADAMEIYVAAKQWMWKFAYPDGRSSISVLTVPVGRPVKLNMISQDVIHSFSVPAFRIKFDVLPGRYTTVWFEVTEPGTHQILCAELCGTGHSNMWGTIVALGPEDYESWLHGNYPAALEIARQVEIARRPEESEDDTEVRGRSAAPGSTSRLAEVGREVAVRHACFACHTLDGRAHIGPTWRGLYGSSRALSDGTTVVADAAYLTESMMDPRARLVAGFAPVMPSFQGILSAPETAALVELIRSVREGEPRRDPIPGGRTMPGLPTSTLRAPPPDDPPPPDAP